jgi:hypothetical protein
MPKYTVTNAGYFYGKFYPEGAVLELHPKQAKYEMMAGNLKEGAPASAPVEPLPTAPARPAPKKRSVSEST